MIVGAVARILSDKEVILSVGSDDGVKQDMEFVIFSEGDHITDPETEEDLGAIETIKGRVTVYHVQQKMSRAKTRTYQVTVPSPYQLKSATLFGDIVAHTETRRSVLEVDEQDIAPIKDELVVKVGDRVRSI